MARGSRGERETSAGTLPLRECVIFDLDGTFAFLGDRSPYDMHGVDRTLTLEP